MRPLPTNRGNAPAVVVGAGIAGLATALRLAPMPVVIVTGGTIDGECATRLAQGGIAAAIGPGDSSAQHAADTVAAAGGLGDEGVAGQVASAADGAIDWLVSRGVHLDRDGSGELALRLEAAHGQPRILHAGGDRTGQEIMRALTAAVRATPSISIVEQTSVAALMRDRKGAVVGVRLRRGAEILDHAARGVVLATGGIGGLFGHTTNPVNALGSGLALGARAGAVLRDLEFVQFHPTAIDIGRDPMPLATEALRGEGARLVDLEGNDVLADVSGGALAARDVVASAIFARLGTGERVFLELPNTLAPRVAAQFPGLAAVCSAAGVSLTRIPVRPAAHYHMGGLKVDRRGRTNVDGLWACGEVASTGLHGANRLASNSLLEAVAYAAVIANDLKGMLYPLGGVRITQVIPVSPVAAADPPIPLAALRALMDRHVGVVRDEQGLTQVVRSLGGATFTAESSPANDVSLAALLIAIAARSRRETRGAHCRADYPHPAGAAHSQEVTLGSARAAALEITSGEAGAMRMAR